MLVGKREGNVFQSLEGHTKDALLALRGLTEGGGFGAFCERWGLDKREALLSAVLCVALHDAGKAALAFQRAIEEDRHRPDLPHPLFSLIVAAEAWREGKFPSIWEIRERPVLELLAILAHHSLLWSGIYKNVVKRDARPEFPDELADFLEEVGIFAAQTFDLPEARRVGRRINIRGFRERTLGTVVDTALEFLKQATGKISDKPKLKAIYCWLLHLVKASDLAASQAFTERAKKEQEGEVLGPVFQEPPALWAIPLDFEGKILRGRKPFLFQERMAEVEEPFAVLRAPCGRGKTEAALLWFAAVRKRFGLERLVFAMPTQVTSNAMRERLAKVFGEGNVGLYHGRSYLEHREISALKLGAERPEEDLDPRLEAELAREENFLGEVMIKPVTVTTVDHVLYSFVHGFRQADFALGCLQTAAIVFDEVHYYDRKMLSELRELFKILRQMRIPHLLMSGTLPDFLVKEARLHDYALLEDEEGSKFKPFVIEKRKRSLIVRGTWEVDNGAVEEILDGHEKGLVQFVVLNTVRKAQKVYEALREKVPKGEVELLHSRFCYVHRREKEKQVMKALDERKGPFLLVSTQVIEVSLDISCDRMFTELAPMDAVGQRAGRLNRGARTFDGHKLAVFLPLTPEGELDCLPYKDVREVVEATWEVLQEAPTSYSDIKEWCDKVYEGFTLGVAQLPEFFERCTLFGPNYDEIRFSEEEGRAFKPREIHVPTVDVIPCDVLVEEPQVGEDPSKAVLYLAPVPVWWVAVSNEKGLGLFAQREIGRRVFLICRLPYSAEIGFDEEKIGAPPEGVIVD